MASPGGVRAGKAFVEILARDDQLVKGLKSAQARLKRFGAATSAMGAKFFGAGAALSAPLLGAAKAFASTGDMIQKMTFRSGMSAETLSQLAFAAQQSGIDILTLDRALAAMARAYGQADRGAAAAVEAFERLGLSMDDLKRLTPENRFTTIADRLAKLSDPTMRAALAMQVFGRSGRDMLPLLDQGATGIKALRDEADRLGLTMSTRDANAAAELTDAWGRIGSVLKRLVFGVGAALAPLLTDIANRAAQVAKNAIEWIDANRGLIVSAAKLAVMLMIGGAALLALGGAAVAAGAILGGTATAVTTLGGVLAALLSPIGLVIAGLGSLAAWFLTSTAAGGATLDWLGDRFDDLTDTALKSFQGIKDAMVAGDLALAAKILWLSLKKIWLEGTEPLRQIWHSLVAAVQDTWTDTVFNLAAVWAQASALLKKGWAHTTSFVQDAWVVVTTGIQNTWYRVVGALQKAWARFKSFVGEDIDVKAEFERIDRTTRAKMGVNRRLQDEMIASSERQRTTSLVTIEQTRTGTLAELEKGRQAARAKHTEQFNRALASAGTELDAAKKEWRAAMDEAAKASANKTKLDEESAKEPSLPDRLQSIFDAATKAGATGKQIATKTDVTGSFSAFALRGMGEVLGPQEKIEKHTRETAAQSKKMADALKDLSLTFS